MTAYLSMGGYGEYVWSAFAITTLALVVLLLHTLQRRRHLRALLAKYEQDRNATGNEP